MIKNKLPGLDLQLVDPKSKEPLIYQQQEKKLISSESSYSVHEYDGGARFLLDFKPDCLVEKGAYVDEAPAEDFSSFQKSGEPFRKNYKEKTLKHIVSCLKEGDIVADLGCSNCEVLRAIGSQYVRIGVDISSKAMLNRVPNAFDSDVNYLLICDAVNLPFEDNSLDAVLCNDILEHLLKPDQLLKEVYRILKPGGYLYITVPNLVSIGNRLSFLMGDGRGLELVQMLKGKNPFTVVNGPRFPDQTMHLRWFTSKSLALFLQSFDFSIREKFGVGPVTTRLPFSNFTHNVSLLIGMLAQKQ